MHAEQDYITAAGVLLSLIVIKIGLHVQRTNALRPLQWIEERGEDRQTSKTNRQEKRQINRLKNEKMDG